MNAGRRRIRRLGLAAALGLALTAATVHASDGRASAPAAAPEFTLAPERGLVGGFAGFGAQFNQHVYADISGRPPNFAGLEQKVLAARPQFVRVFFNTSEWTLPDRMASFNRTVALARRSEAQIDITWQGSTFAFAMANMSRFADVLTDLVEGGHMSSLWVTLFNEPNSTRLTLSQYEQVYRLLDAQLRERGVRERVHFMGGDLVGTTSPLGQSQAAWLGYLADHMGDLLDAWSVHVYWNFWDAGKIDRRLLAEVRTIFSGIPSEKRRPVYVTEFGVRGVPTFEGEPGFDPGFSPDGTPMAVTTTAAFQDAWFMIRAAQLGFQATAKWDLYRAKYDVGTQDYSAIGDGAEGWPTRPAYNLLQLLTVTTEPRGGNIVELVRSPAADPAKLLSAYVSPGSGVTILGLDTAGGTVGAAAAASANVSYSIGGLPPNTLFRLVVWNADGLGTNRDIGFLSSGSTGTLGLSVPLDAVFALTSTSLVSPPW